MGFNVKVTEI